MVNAGGPDARVAAYYCPAEDDPLFAAGARWLGRDPATGAVCRQPALPGINEITAEARRYGFHATLKPPMRLRPGCTWEDVLGAAGALAQRLTPFDLPPLSVADPHGFLALREQIPSPALHELADASVAALDIFRAPPTEEELARRSRARLNAAQDAMLARWGYPYVFGEWFFHMTLTRRLNETEHAVWRPAVEEYFAQAVRTPRRVEDICLFTQPEPGAPFTIAARLPLRG